MSFGRRALIAWALALGILFVLDLVLAHSALLFRPWPFERSSDPSRAVLGQTFTVLRKLREATQPGHERVLLLGSSRVAMAVWDEDEVERLAAARGAELQLDNLSIFGAAIPEIAAVAGLVGPAQARLAVLAIGPTELLGPPTPTHPVHRLLADGAGSGEGEDAPLTARIERAARRLWTLFGHREFVRAALTDLVLGRSMPDPPQRFASIDDFNARLDPAASERIRAAYRAFEKDPSLESYLAYVGPERLAPYRKAVAAWQGPRPDALAALDASLTELTRGSEKTVVLLLPDSPLRQQDRSGALYRAELEEAAVVAIRDAARRHGVEVIDARAWIGPERYLDFHHLMPGLSGFEERFVEEVTRAVGS